MKVAVYGTLKRGFGNNRLLTTSEFVGEGNTNNGWSLMVPMHEDMVASFPYAVEMESDQGIQCEIYEVNDDTLRSLDSLEGYPYFYNRKEVEVKMDDGNTVKANMYFVREDQVPRNSVKKHDYRRSYR